MKILSIVSSYRQDGNTARVVSLLEEQLQKTAESRGIPLEVDRVPLSRMNIGICRGCRLCFDKGESKCPLQDDLLPIRDRMLMADGLLIASPVYVEDVNGILKNFIDRMAYLNHRPGFYGKSALLINTSGAGASGHALRTMGSALSAWGCRIAYKAKFRTGALTGKEEIRTAHEKNIRKAADAFLNDLIRGTDTDPGIYSMIAFKVQQIVWSQEKAKAANPYDHAYWKEKGWLDKGCAYYLPLKKGRIKNRFARLMASGIAKFFV